MQIFAEAFWLPKAGNTPAEYEDAFFPSDALKGKVADTCRFAVADGATEASFSRIWAELLVRSYCEGGVQHVVNNPSLQVLQEQWSAAVQRPNMPWYMEEKIRSGSYAALVGLELVGSPAEEEGGTWSAIAVGDSCLVHMQMDEIRARFPLENSASFNNRPMLLSSNPAANQDLESHTFHATGKWGSGDAFYLMSDALACWFMREAEEGRAPWKDLRDVGTNEFPPFDAWIQWLRDEQKMRNDDVTLLRVDVL